MKQSEDEVRADQVTEEMSAPPRSEPREALRWFVQEMEAKLRANDHKGHWRGCDDAYLLSRMSDEKMELRKAARELASGWRESDEKARALARVLIGEAADLANFAMMIADNVRVFFGAERESPSVTRIAAAYVFDRAHQFDPSSGIHDALCTVAAQLRDDEHLAAFRAGDLDDLLAKDSGRTDPEKKDPHT